MKSAINVPLIRVSNAAEDDCGPERPVDMSNHRNSLLDLHPAAVAGSLLGSRPAGPAPRDAEPDFSAPRPSRIRRILAAYRARRAGAASAETRHA